jgi:hypothetical protein
VGLITELCFRIPVSKGGLTKHCTGLHRTAFDYIGLQRTTSALISGAQLGLGLGFRLALVLMLNHQSDVVPF